MKMKNRFLGILLSLALMLSLLPGMSMTALAEDTKIGTATYTISDGALTVGSGNFTIENWASVFGTGGGTNTTPNSTASSIKSVTFESGATLNSNSSKFMFNNWSALETADLTNLTASNVTDMSWMFGNCSKLTSVTFGSGIETSNVQYMSQMFQGCSSLTELDLSTFKVYTGSGKRSLHQTFYDCSNLVTIRVSDDWCIPKLANGKDALEGNYTFNGCSKLVGGNGTQANGFGNYSYAVIDGKDGKSGYFTSASAGAVHRHDFTYSASGNTLTVTCSADDCTLTGNKVELTLTPPAKTVYGDSNSAAATIEGREAFNSETGCQVSSLETFKYYKKGSDSQYGSAPTTPGEYTVKVNLSNIAGGPYEISADYTIAQKEVGLTWGTTEFTYDNQSHVPTATATGLVGNDQCTVTVTGAQTDVGDNYIATASSLSNDRYKLPENNTTSFSIVAKVGTAPYTIDNGVLTVQSGSFTGDQWKTVFTNSKSTITSVKFESGATLTDSAAGMFQDWTELTSVDLSNLTTSSLGSTQAMFAGCTKLTELDLSTLNTGSVTNMGGMFYGCTSLEKIVVGSGWSTQSVTYAPAMFTGCLELDGHAGTTYRSLVGSNLETDGANAPDIGLQYAHVDGGKANPGLFYNAHEHNMTYTVDSNAPWTITGKCTADSCYLDADGVTISIVKPTLYVYWMDELNKKEDGSYDKSASPFATLTMQTVGDQTLGDAGEADPDGIISGINISASTFADAQSAAADFNALTGANISDSSIEYYEGNTKLNSAPRQAGTYTAKITIGGATASVDYRIAQRFHSPVTTSPQAVENLVSDGTTAKALVSAGAVEKVDDTDTSALQYALGENETIIPTEGWNKDVPTATAAGDYYVFYKVVGDKNHGDAMQSEFPNKSGYAGDTYNKPAFSVIKVTMMGVVTAPEAKQLTYNGQAQELVTAGTAHGGTMQYVLGTDAATAPTTGYTTSIPTATDAGTYYVWYKVIGDQNHNDTVADSPITVTISERHTPSGGGTVTDPVKNVINLINKIPDPVTQKDADTVKVAREAYDKLTDKQKEDPRLTEEVMKKLTDAEAAIEAEKQKAADQAAAKAFDDVVAGLPADAGTWTREQLDAALAAYNKLTDPQKGLVNSASLTKMQTAEYSLAVADAKVKKTKLKSAKAKKGKKAQAKWAKNTTATGYQLVYSTSKKFTKKTTRKVTIKNNKTVKKTVKKLKKGKTYYFKVRPYTKVNNEVSKTASTVYGKWSNVKKCKAK